MTTFELGRRLLRLEQQLRDLEVLQHQVHEEALALSQTVTDPDGRGTRSGGMPVDASPQIYSIPDAAQHLGISVSMVHKLLRERRLGHLKVGARTLITAEHVEAFLVATAVVPTVDPAVEAEGEVQGATQAHDRGRGGGA